MPEATHERDGGEASSAFPRGLGERAQWGEGDPFDEVWRESDDAGFGSRGMGDDDDDLSPSEGK